jgi:hypothetical protein
MSVQLIIPCKHESGEVEDWHERVDDYHPLSMVDIIELLTMTKNAEPGSRTRNDVHIRLNKGIQGHVCPNELDSMNQTIDAQVGHLYVNWCDNDLAFQDIPIPVFAATLYPLLHWQDAQQAADAQEDIGELRAALEAVTSERDVYKDAAIECDKRLFTGLLAEKNYSSTRWVGMVDGAQYVLAPIRHVLSSRRALAVVDSKPDSGVT